jgi:hypothetical protein
MRAFLVAAALVTIGTGCVADDNVTPARGLDDPAMASAPFALGERPLPEASCVASVERFEFANGTCVARATVRFTCPAASQVHDWARVGILCDGEVCAYDDVRYSCDGELARSFAFPCAAGEVVGGATFDHPVTSADVSCISP